MAKDYYEVLGIPETASAGQIKVAYLQLARRYHPDHNRTEEAVEIMKQLNIAFQVLSDPKKREGYDAELRDHRTRVGVTLNEILSQQDIRSRLEYLKRGQLYDALAEIAADRSIRSEFRNEAGVAAAEGFNATPGADRFRRIMHIAISPSVPPLARDHAWKLAAQCAYESGDHEALLSLLGRDDLSDFSRTLIENYAVIGFKEKQDIEMLRAISETAHISPDSREEAVLGIADALGARGDSSGLLELLTSSLSTEPVKARASYHLVTVLKDSGDFQKLEDLISSHSLHNSCLEAAERYLAMGVASTKDIQRLESLSANPAFSLTIREWCEGVLILLYSEARDSEALRKVAINGLTKKNRCKAGEKAVDALSSEGDMAGLFSLGMNLRTDPDIRKVAMLALQSLDISETRERYDRRMAGESEQRGASTKKPNAPKRPC